MVPAFAIQTRISDAPQGFPGAGSPAVERDPRRPATLTERRTGSILLGGSNSVRASQRIRSVRPGTVSEDRDLKIQIEREDDGRWIAEVPDLPGVMVYGDTRERAVARAEALALRVIADRLDHGEPIPELDELFAVSP